MTESPAKRAPIVKALAAIVDSDARVLLQCDLQESFYRLPGGTVELGEIAAAAVARELLEEYGLPVLVGPLLVVVENRFTAADRLQHEIALVHQTSIEPHFVASQGGFLHVEQDGIQLVWRDLARVGSRLVPNGMDRILRSRTSHPVHLVIGEGS